MDVYQVSLIVIPPICAFLGYFGKYLLEKKEKESEEAKNKQLKIIEHKLKHFYYPIHCNLIRENLIFNKILRFYQNDTDIDEILVNKIFWELDNEMLNIHEENQNIIKDNFVEMHFSEELGKLLMQYDEHVSIYKILRRVNTEKPTDMKKVLWPGNFGSFYPRKLLSLIEDDLKNFKTEQTDIVYSKL